MPVEIRSRRDCLAARLQARRLELDWSIPDAARSLDVSSEQLCRFEAGVDVPDGEVMVRFAATYEVDLRALSRFEHRPSMIEASENELRFGWFTVNLEGAGASNEARLTAVARGLRYLRSVGPLEPVRLRGSELDQVIAVLDLPDPDLIRLWVRLFRVPWSEADASVRDAAARVAWARVREQARQLAPSHH